MNSENPGTQPNGYVKLLIVTNIVTLVVLIVVLVSRPAPLPELEKMEQMVEAQDWLIGKMTEHRIQLVIENTRLKFGQHQPAPESELDDRLKAYEASRAEWGRDLDVSRDNLEAEYQAKHPD